MEEGVSLPLLLYSQDLNPYWEGDEMEQRHILSISGGKDSMATAILALEHREPLDVAVYCEVMFDKETSGEVPEHREFIYNCMIPWMEGNGVPVHVVRGERTYLDLFYHVIKQSKIPERNGRLLGFPIAGKCQINARCKTKPLDRYIKESGSNDAIQYVGIAADEEKRLKRLDGKTKISLLEKYGYTEADAAELCKKYGLYSPVYEFSTRNGCWFCPNCRNREFAEFKRRHPDLWQRLLDLGKTENLVSYGFKYGKPIEKVDRDISMQAAQMRLWE